MSDLELFKKLMEKARSNGYTDYERWGYELGRLMDGTNYYAIIFDRNFANAIWEIDVELRLQHLVVAEDKWKYLEETVNFN